MNHFDNSMNDGKHIFVFGSNERGVHGAGAAATAKKFWGAQSWIGNGRQGQAYGIPTKDFDIKTLPLSEIKTYVDEFLEYAKQHRDLTFLVTKIGCGLAGYTEDDIKPFFKNASKNCILPDGW